MSRDLPTMRRIAVFDIDGRSNAILDDVPSDGITDPARPGFSTNTYWATDAGAPVVNRTPEASITFPNVLEPAVDGAICRVVTYPPESAFIDSVTAEDVANYFDSVDAAQASTYSADGKHPYMHRTETVDFCMVIAGEITLVLDTEEVDLSAGDTALLRATNHAWSNRSAEPCILVISSHHASGAATA